MHLTEENLHTLHYTSFSLEKKGGLGAPAIRLAPGGKAWYDKVKTVHKGSDRL